MKFTKKYETYMRGIRMEEEQLPGVGLKRLKKMLKKCRSELSSHQETPSSAAAADGVRCAGHCSGKNHDRIAILASFCYSYFILVLAWLVCDFDCANFESRFPVSSFLESFPLFFSLVSE
jgi:hypothetical protein